jgi:hypothetical protein
LRSEARSAAARLEWLGADEEPDSANSNTPAATAATSIKSLKGPEVRSRRASIARLF